MSTNAHPLNMPAIHSHLAELEQRADLDGLTVGLAAAMTGAAIEYISGRTCPDFTRKAIAQYADATGGRLLYERIPADRRRELISALRLVIAVAEAQAEEPQK